MASQDFLQTRALNKKGVAVNVVDDKPVALRIRNIGHAVTHVIVTAATKIELHDADASTDVAFGTYTTVGAVADYINSLANWECKVLDALRSDASASVFVEETITASVINGVSYYDVRFDTSAIKAYTYRLTHDRGVATDKPTNSYRCHLREIKYYADVNAAAADGVQVWACKDTNETQIFSGVSVDATETTVSWASGAAFISGGEGEDLVVRVKDATSLTDSGSGYLRVAGEVE